MLIPMACFWKKRLSDWVPQMSQLMLPYETPHGGLINCWRPSPVGVHSYAEYMNRLLVSVAVYQAEMMKSTKSGRSDKSGLGKFWLEVPLLAASRASLQHGHLPQRLLKQDSMLLVDVWEAGNDLGAVGSSPMLLQVMYKLAADVFSKTVGARRPCN